ncbi:MAG: hypothetical protein HZA88_23160 [Verrucomicrobia bacterium]|nr:hypothetical protein [Verrucomicrobiota bacterium]
MKVTTIALMAAVVLAAFIGGVIGISCPIERGLGWMFIELMPWNLVSVPMVLAAGAGGLLFAISHRILPHTPGRYSQFIWRVSLLWCAASIGTEFLPMDLFDRPPGTRLLCFPPDSRVLSCYAVETYPELKRAGGFKLLKQGYFGWTWRTRRGFSGLDGLDIGPTVSSLHLIPSRQLSLGLITLRWISVCVFESGGRTNAIVLYPIGGLTSGDYGVIVTLSERVGETWQKIYEEEKYIDLDDCFFRSRASIATSIVVCPVLIGFAVLLIGVFSRKRVQQYAAVKTSLLMIPVTAILLSGLSWVSMIFTLVNLLGPLEAWTHDCTHILDALFLAALAFAQLGLGFVLYTFIRAYEERKNKHSSNS